MFEADGKPMGPIKWGVWALFIPGNSESSLSNTPRKITLKARMFRGLAPKSRMRKLPKGERQLVIRTTALLSNGEQQPLNVLVDTGAEACLVRQGLMPAHLMYPAPKPLKFETADGQPLLGGDRCIKVRLLLLCESNELNTPEEMEFEVEFFEANIKVDAILSYPWLSQAKLGIFPHHKALVLDSQDLKFLHGVRDHSKMRPDSNSPDFSKLAVSGISEIELLPEKFGFHLPEIGFDQRLRFLKADELAEVAAHLVYDSPPPCRSTKR